MRNVCLIFIFVLLLLSGFLAGCRAKLDTSGSSSRRQTDVIGLELRKLDSLWRSSSERQTLKIEFYRPEMPESDDIFFTRDSQGSPSGTGDLAAAPDVFMPAALPAQGFSPVGGGMGAVKSIEISTEKVEESSSINATDSTYNNIRAEQETRETSTVSEARQDNGTVATVCIVFAVAALIYLMLKSLLK